MDRMVRKNIIRSSIWRRLVFMLVLAIAFNVAELIIFVVAMFQFLASLFSGTSNSLLTRFGRNLALYLQQVIKFVTFATEEKPFPFSSWPEGANEDSKADQENDKSESSIKETVADKTKVWTQLGEGFCASLILFYTLRLQITFLIKCVDFDLHRTMKLPNSFNLIHIKS